MNFPVEGEVSMPRFLFGALGPQNARVITERMIQLRKSPEERIIAEEVERSILIRNKDL